MSEKDGKKGREDQVVDGVDGVEDFSKERDRIAEDIIRGKTGSPNDSVPEIKGIVATFEGIARRIIEAVPDRAKSLERLNQFLQEVRARLSSLERNDTEVQSDSSEPNLTGTFAFFLKEDAQK